MGMILNQYEIIIIIIISSSSSSSNHNNGSLSTTYEYSKIEMWRARLFTQVICSQWWKFGSVHFVDELISEDWGPTAPEILLKHKVLNIFRFLQDRLPSKS